MITRAIVEVGRYYVNTSLRAIICRTPPRRVLLHLYTSNLHVPLSDCIFFQPPSPMVEQVSLITIEVDVVTSNSRTGLLAHITGQ